MRTAIIGGTGFYAIPGAVFNEQIVETPYGRARVFQGEDQYADLFFLARHGVRHSVPPHRINYRANIKALEQLGVRRVLATFAVGSLRLEIPPLALVAIDQFLDFTQNRANTFYDDARLGFAHTDMTSPVCSGLHAGLLRLAQERGLSILPSGTYVCTNGPRLETSAEIRMFARLGGDVVGMTGVPEIPLARELGLHYAALAYVINYGAGLETGHISFVDSGLNELKDQVLRLFIDTLALQQPPLCDCETSRFSMHAPDPEAADQ
jgi:5'-methylthioadenosine phosphorylase